MSISLKDPVPKSQVTRRVVGGVVVGGLRVHNHVTNVAQLAPKKLHIITPHFYYRMICFYKNMGVGRKTKCIMVGGWCQHQPNFPFFFGKNISLFS